MDWQTLKELRLKTHLAGRASQKEFALKFGFKADSNHTKIKSRFFMTKIKFVNNADNDVTTTTTTPT